MQELTFKRGEYNIYGRLYLPGDQVKPPLVILSHGYNCDITSTEGFAQCLSHKGVAAYCYDFVGGCPTSRSGGKTTEMSVLTEAADLRAVIEGFKQDELIDPDRIFLMGFSQGGFVSTYAACSRPDDIRGLIPCYPAYILQADSERRRKELPNLPEVMDVMGMTIGGVYTEDSLSFDIYNMMPNYTRKVLILHGTCDSVVPYSGSERAVKTFPDAELVLIEGADHWFADQDFVRAVELAADFVHQNS